MNYGLDVSTTGEFSDPRLLTRLAVEAEEAGWDGFFIWDVIYNQDDQTLPTADPWVTLASIASATERIRIGAMVTPLPRRRPWLVARQTATLDHLSNGRMIFGAGLGYQDLEFAPFGEDTDPKVRAEKLDEGLEVLAGLWKGGPFCFKGEHFQVEVERFLPVPVQQPRIPVWIAGYWPNRRPFRRAARWDGVYIGAGRADGQPAMLEDVRAAIAYVKAHSDHEESLEIAFCYEGPVDPNIPYIETVRPFLEAGVTWWIEGIHQWAGTVEDMHQKIRMGPPRVYTGLAQQS